LSGKATKATKAIRRIFRFYVGAGGGETPGDLLHTPHRATRSLGRPTVVNESADDAANAADSADAEAVLSADSAVSGRCCVYKQYATDSKSDVKHLFEHLFRF
jgi:hypothetical protein